MNLKRLTVATVLHFGLSLGFFLGINGWAVGIQDAGSAAPGAARWIEIPLHFILLQPLAHWVVTGLAIPWWTWPGLAGIAVLFALNSIIAVALVCGILSMRGAGIG
jgi:hypothetical protein